LGGVGAGEYLAACAGEYFAADDGAGTGEYLAATCGERGALLLPGFLIVGT
jgi:hypothetical protein